MKRISTLVAALIASNLVFATVVMVADGWPTLLVMEYFIAGQYTCIYALWPCLLLSRLALQHTWILIPAAMLVGGILLRRSRWAPELSGINRPKLFLYTSLGTLVYLSLGVAYIHLFPVPHPVATELALETDTAQNVRVYLASYEEAYRWGITGGGYLNYNGVFSDATRKGWLDGNLHGAAEWQRVFPGVFSSTAERVVKARRQSKADESSEQQNQ